MRPQQQNRRMRGRSNNGGGNNNNNNNRKGPNPLNRNYESNGPDVKIRGSAQQIAEKYATLARDAQSSGDRVMAENYLQHAEHYNRIIAAAQAQMPIQHQQQNRDDFDDDGDEDREDFENAGSSNAEVQVPVVNHGAGPQPVIEGTPAEVALNTEGGRDNRRNNRDGNGARHRDRRPNGGYGQNSQRGDYQSRGEQNGSEAGEPDAGNEVPVRAEAETASSAAEPATQVDRLSPAGLAAQAELNQGGPKEDAGEGDATPRRAKRPRRPRAAADKAEGGTAETAAAESGGEPAAVTEG